MTQSQIIKTSAGAVTLAVAAPVLLAIAGLIKVAWPLIPLLVAGSACLASDNKNHSKNKKDDDT